MLTTLRRTVVIAPATLGVLLGPKHAWATQPCPPGYEQSLWSQAPAAILALFGIAATVELLRRGRPGLALLMAFLASALTFAALIVAGFTGSCVPA